MTDEEQYRSTIYIADSKGEVKGCGFIVGTRQVMTCAHVIRFCRQSEAAALGDAAFYVLGQKDKASFRLKVATNQADMVDDDVAILELDQNENFHDSFAVVRWEPCEAGLGYAGTGIIQAQDDGGQVHLQKVAVDGTVRNLASGTRHFVSASQDDLRLDAGCSGGAVFNKAGTRDLIGMVSEYQQDMSGTIIRAQALRDCWPAMLRGGSGSGDGDGASVGGGGADPFVDLAPKPAAPGLVLADLDESIACCDREAQADPFRDHLRQLGLQKARKGALLTTIHGQPLDLPDRLSDRLSDMGFRAVHEGNPLPGGKRPPRPNIDMAKCAAATEEAMRARLEYRLQDTLRSDRPDLASFADAIRKLGRPLLIEVRATELFLAANGPMAAAVWTKFAAELAAQDLGNPILIFFVVTRSGDPAGDAAMAKWGVADPCFLVLEELGPIPVDEVNDWAESIYDSDIAEQIKTIVAAKAQNAPGVRLKQLHDWLSGA